ncbi:unnamed protein product [Closterium sp. Naga37s-1]|nr:unnamed protein product [Closterium sp. Naga37s-1]
MSFAGSIWIPWIPQPDDEPEEACQGFGINQVPNLEPASPQRTRSTAFTTLSSTPEHFPVFTNRKLGRSASPFRSEALKRVKRDVKSEPRATNGVYDSYTENISARFVLLLIGAAEAAHMCKILDTAGEFSDH